jgi:polyisoprenyl-teichoic acid--peptidoglycan teichoic acid transferase
VTITVLLVVTIASLAGLLMLGAFGLVDRARELVGAEPEAESEALPGDRQPTMAIVTHDEEAPDDGPLHVALFAHDREDGEGTVLFVPPSTMADVPGHGSFGVGEAFSFGGAPLLGVTLENLLGVRVDEVIGMTEAEWAALLERVGGFEVDVPSRLDAPDGEPRFQAGQQALDGPRLAEYLTIRAAGESELDVLPRLQRVLQGLLDTLAEQPHRFDDLFADGAPMLGVGDPEPARELLERLTEARAQGRLAMLTLPVSPLGSDRTDAYRVDADRLEQLIEERLAAARPGEQAGAGRSLQVLNGVGTPGVGQAVAELLQPGGYRVLLTGNADSFDHEDTRIVIYDDAEEQVDVARDIRDRLGVGSIERSGMPQSVVDVTIIVGEDLLEAGLAEDLDADGD